MRKVKITGLPKAKHGGSQHTGPQAPPVDNTTSPGRASYHAGNTPEIKTNRTLQPTERENATLEAEKGETVITNLQDEGIPEFYKIAGKRHSRGGTPLNLPANSFIFSRDNKLKIKDPEVLALFGKINKKKKGFTPADLSKTYDLNEYREILANPFSDRMQRETAELMIQNYNMKLGSLALVQESMKGFDNGIPAVSMAYMENNGISPDDLLGGGQPTEHQLQTFKKGGNYSGKRRIRITGLPKMQYAGQQPLTPLVPLEQDVPLAETEVSMKINKEDAKRVAKPVIAGGMDFTAMVGDAVTDTTETDMSKLTSADQVFTANDQTYKGHNTFNKVGNDFVIDNTPIMNTGLTAKFGGSQGMPQYNNGGGNFATRNLTPYYNEDGSTDWLDRRGNIVRQDPPPGSAQASAAQPKVSSKVTYKLPKDAVVWQAGHDKNDLQVGEYIMGEDGKPRKITGFERQTYEGDYLSDNANLSTELQQSYGLMKDKIENTPGLRQAIIDGARAELEAAQPNDQRLKADQLDAAKAMSDDELMENFYNYQLKNYAVANKVKNIEDKGDKWDHKGNPADALIADMGFDANDGATTAAFQGAYIALQKAAETDEYKDSLSDLQITPIGVGDEADRSGTGKATISGVDGWYGNTTAGQTVIPKDNKAVLEDVEAVQAAPENKALFAKAYDHDTPFWSQDVANIGLGFSNLMGIRNQQPFQAVPQFNLARPAFADFRGAAARINSQGAMLQQSCNNLAPMQRAACLAKIQSSLVNPILQLQEQDNRTNIGTQNQFEKFNTQGLNAYNRHRAGLATQLFDKTTVANQQFQNAKTQAKQNLVAQLNSAWTNRGKTDTMNQLHPDYAVDPVTGYLKHDPSGRELTPNKVNEDQEFARMARIHEEFPNQDMGDIYSRIYGKPQAGVTAQQANPQGYPGVAYTQGAPGSNRPPTNPYRRRG